MRQRDKPTRPNRIKTAIAAVMIDSAGSQQPVEIVDLSSSGFRLRAGTELAEKSDITLRVRGHGDFPAHIQWVLGLNAGGRFAEPVLLM
jgi:hypothetical protein